VAVQLHDTAALSARKKFPSTHGVEGWMGLMVGQDALLKANSPYICRAWNHGSSVVQPVA
jgi:hypothetical protein